MRAGCRRAIPLGTDAACKEGLPMDYLGYLSNFLLAITLLSIAFQLSAESKLGITATGGGSHYEINSLELMDFI